MPTGLLLGAGASFEVGMPLVSDLTTEIRTWLTPEKLRGFNASWVAEGGGHPAEIIDDLVRVLREPGMHYESILGYLEVQYTRPGPNERKQHYHGLYSWLVEMVSILLYLRHVNNAAYIDAGLRFLEGLVGFANDNFPLWVFSLNHDLIVEMLATKYALPISAGFRSQILLPIYNDVGAKTAELPVEVLAAADIEASQFGFFQPGTRGVNLLKVHGGLDMFTFRDGADLVRLRPLNDSVDGWMQSLRLANCGLKFYHPITRQPAKATNEIAFADDQGEMQFLRRTLLAGAFKFDQRHGQVLPDVYLSWFENFLNRVSSLVCVGYGFQDSHINSKICRWLEFDPGRRLEIVSPNATQIPAPLLHLTPQITMTNQTATGFFQAHAARPLTELESQLKALRERERHATMQQRGYN